MSGEQLFMCACLVFVLGRWAQSETAVSVKIVCAIVFGAFAFAIMDGTAAADFSKMLAALILVVACLKAISIKGISDAITGAVTSTETVGVQPGFQLDASVKPADSGYNLYVTGAPPATTAS